MEKQAVLVRAFDAAESLLLSLATFVIGGTMLLAACGSSPSSVARTDDEAGLVDLGGGRKMYLECHGTGSPTVVLVSGGYEAGWIWSYALYPTDPVHEEPMDGFSVGRGDPQKLASAVLPTVGKVTRVCTYDRPNTTLGDNIRSEREGQISTPVDQPHPVEHDVEDLHALLNAANDPGPYVLVAHSYGGLIAELYASRYPEDVVGRVYVDVTSVFLRESLPPDDYQALIESTSTPPEPGAEALEIGNAIEVISEADPAPPMPVIVLGADKPADSGPKTLERFPHLNEAQHLLAEHLCAKYITRTNSAHHIHVEQPQLVNDATREVVEAVRQGCTTLPCDGVPPKPDTFVTPLPCALRP